MERIKFIFLSFIYIFIIFNKILNILNIKFLLQDNINNNKHLNYFYLDNNYNLSLNSIKNSKKVVYSVLFGKYDSIRSFNLQEGFDFILFTDIKYIKKNETNWTIFPIPKEVDHLNISNVKKQRFIKLHPHLYFMNYDLSIYIDTSFQIIGDLNEFLLRIISPKYNIYNL